MALIRKRTAIALSAIFSSVFVSAQREWVVFPWFAVLHGLELQTPGRHFSMVLPLTPLPFGLKS